MVVFMPFKILDVLMSVSFSGSAVVPTARKVHRVQSRVQNGMRATSCFVSYVDIINV